MKKLVFIVSFFVAIGGISAQASPSEVENVLKCMAWVEFKSVGSPLVTHYSDCKSNGTFESFKYNRERYYLINGQTSSLFVGKNLSPSSVSIVRASDGKVITDMDISSLRDKMSAGTYLWGDDKRSNSATLSNGALMHILCGGVSERSLIISNANAVEYLINKK